MWFLAYFWITCPFRRNSSSKYLVKDYPTNMVVLQTTIGHNPKRTPRNIQDDSVQMLTPSTQVVGRLKNQESSQKTSGIMIATSCWIWRHLSCWIFWLIVSGFRFVSHESASGQVPFCRIWTVRLVWSRRSYKCCWTRWWNDSTKNGFCRKAGGASPRKLGKMNPFWLLWYPPGN